MVLVFALSPALRGRYYHAHIQLRGTPLRKAFLVSFSDPAGFGEPRLLGDGNSYDGETGLPGASERTLGRLAGPLDFWDPFLEVVLTARRDWAGIAGGFSLRATH